MEELPGQEWQESGTKCRMEQVMVLLSDGASILPVKWNDFPCWDKYRTIQYRHVDQ